MMQAAPTPSVSPFAVAVCNITASSSPHRSHGIAAISAPLGHVGGARTVLLDPPVAVTDIDGAHTLPRVLSFRVAAHCAPRLLRLHDQPHPRAATRGCRPHADGAGCNPSWSCVSPPRIGPRVA